VTPLVSIVVPVLGDTDAAAALLRQVSPDFRTEMIIVDGGLDERLGALAGTRPDVRLLRAPAGRGGQMNAGAAAATGTWLLFLHADSTLPERWVSHFERLPATVAGGWFRFALDDRAWQARLVERGVAWRVRLFRLPYGDQGIFVRREVFARLGGFRELRLMEDVDFVRRLRREDVMQLPAPLVTSARRWRRDGWFRRSARNVALLLLYFAGVPPARLARWYDTAP